MPRLPLDLHLIKLYCLCKGLVTFLINRHVYITEILSVSLLIDRCVKMRVCKLLSSLDGAM